MACTLRTGAAVLVVEGQHRTGYPVPFEANYRYSSGAEVPACACAAGVLGRLQHLRPFSTASILFVLAVLALSIAQGRWAAAVVIVIGVPIWIYAMRDKARWFH